MGQDHTMDPEDSDGPGSGSDVASGVGSHRRMARVIHSRTGATLRSWYTPYGRFQKEKVFQTRPVGLLF